MSKKILPMGFTLFQSILLKIVELKINAMETPAWNTVMYSH